MTVVFRLDATGGVHMRLWHESVYDSFCRHFETDIVAPRTAISPPLAQQVVFLTETSEVDRRNDISLKRIMTKVAAERFCQAAGDGAFRRNCPLVRSAE